MQRCGQTALNFFDIDGRLGRALLGGRVLRRGLTRRVDGTRHVRRSRGHSCRERTCVRLLTHHTGGDDRHADAIAEAFVEGCADDDVGVGIDFLADARGCLVNFVQRQIAATADREQQTACAAQRHVVEQRVGDGFFGGEDSAAFAGGFACAHHGRAHAAHHGANVGEVEVDQAFLYDQIDDAGNARIQHLVSEHEGFGEGRFLVGDPEQVLVGDDDQGIDVLLQFRDADVGNTHAAGAFEEERLGDDAHGQDAKLFGDARDDGCSARAGAAAHAAGNEHHV